MILRLMCVFNFCFPQSYFRISNRLAITVNTLSLDVPPICFPVITTCIFSFHVKKMHFHPCIYARQNLRPWYALCLMWKRNTRMGMSDISLSTLCLVKLGDLIWHVRWVFTEMVICLHQILRFALLACACHLMKNWHHLVLWSAVSLVHQIFAIHEKYVVWMLVNCSRC